MDASPRRSYSWGQVMSGNLTKPQRDLLVEISNGDDRCSDAYRPAQALVDKGLCVWLTESRLGLTPAGRKALSEEGR
jgi:hypothetical protein